MKFFPKKLTQWERGWLSGLIDSDGSICFNMTGARSMTTRIQVDNRSRKLVEKVLETIGSGHISSTGVLSPRKGTLGKTQAPMFRYAAGSGVMRWLLPMLRLTGKEGQRKIILKAFPLLAKGKWRAPSEDQELRKLASEMRFLNSILCDRSK